MIFSVKDDRSDFNLLHDLKKNVLPISALSKWSSIQNARIFIFNEGKYM